MAESRHNCTNRGVTVFVLQYGFKVTKIPHIGADCKDVKLRIGRSWVQYLWCWAGILWGSGETGFQGFLCRSTRTTLTRTTSFTSLTEIWDSSQKRSLPEVFLLSEFGPNFLKDVFRQVRLKDTLLRLPVPLKGFYLKTENDFYTGFCSTFP